MRRMISICIRGRFSSWKSGQKKNKPNGDLKKQCAREKKNTASILGTTRSFEERQFHEVMEEYETRAVRRSKIVVFSKHNQTLPTKFLCWNKWFVRLDTKRSSIQTPPRAQPYRTSLDSSKAVYTGKLLMLISRSRVYSACWTWFN